MPHGEFAKCPCNDRGCTTPIAHGREEIERLFGYRTMDDGKVIPQSFCRACRSARCEAGKPCKVKK